MTFRFPSPIWHFENLLGLLRGSPLSSRQRASGKASDSQAQKMESQSLPSEEAKSFQ